LSMRITATGKFSAECAHMCGLSLPFFARRRTWNYLFVHAFMT
jgi:hypothetical protein